MSFLFGMIGAIVGLLIVIGVIILIVYNKIKTIANPYNLINIGSNFEGIRDIITDTQDDEKSISGLTKLLEPRILQDFPDFNKELIFSKIESNLSQIFNIIENKEIYDNYDIQLVLPSLTEKIEDMKRRQVNETYDNIVFHRHAIKSYEKKDGIATIKISSALEYYYTKKINGNILNNNGNEKKQVRIISTFVYVYDTYKIKKGQPVFIMRCPNCGAPLKYLENMCCEYCKANINEINLKSWLMVSYKEE